MSGRGGTGKPVNPDRRCHWFDSNGRPYKRLDGGLGCPRNKNCYFVHPNDNETWRSARYSGEPPLQYLTDDEYRLIVGRHRSPGRPVYVPHAHQPHQHTHTQHPQHPQHPPLRHRSLSSERRHRRPDRSPARRRSTSRGREDAIAREASLALRIRRRSASREREGRPYGQRSSRSRSPLRTRLQQRTPPPLAGHNADPARTARPYVSIPDGPRGGAASGGGVPRSPMVFPKMEAADVRMKDVAPRLATYVREDSIASTRVPSHQPTPKRPPLSVSATTAGTNTAASGTTSAPTPDTLKTLLESSQLQWQQISTAVAAATSAVPKQNVDIPADEKNKIWTSRIELLAAATRIHNDCRSMDNDIRDYKQLVESFSYQTLPAEDRTVIEGHLHTLQSQLAQKTDEMKKILTQLTAAKFWPTHTYRRAPAGEHDGAQLQEFVGQMRELRNSVTHVQGMVQAVDARWAQIQGTRASGLGGHDAKSGGPRDSLNQASSFLAEAIVPSELEKIRDTLATFGGKLAALQGDVVRQNETYMEQVDAIVAENVQAAVLASTGNVQARPPAPRAALTEEQLRTLQTLQQNAVVTGQQVARLSQEVTQMAARNDQLQIENTQLQASNTQLNQQLEEASQSPGYDSAKIDKMQREMSALNAAVKAYISHGSTQQQQHAVPSADSIVKQLTPYMTKAIPEIIAPELQNMRTQLQETLRTQQSESIKELSSKMSLTLRAVDTIRGLVDKIQKAGQGPIPNVGSPAPVPAQVAANAIPMNGTS